jgi:LuxR family transcriptional regulator, maltose regulon positive regulatory protein
MDEGQAMATTRPAAPSTIIKRPRLTKLLDESAARILLLCAPAGYGKTTLAREWIATRAEPVAWYRGGIEMLDAAAVALALIEVLRGIGLSDDDAGRLTARASRTTRPEELGRAIGAAVPKASGTILAIDDYHHAEASESESLLGAFVDEVDIRILITSRTRPVWVTSRMVVYGETCVLGADELAFTDAEASAVMADETASLSNNLVARARGWPAVIGLAARQKSASATRTDSLLPAELYEYFADDLFRRAPAHLHTSLLLLAMTGGADSQVTRELLGDECDVHLGEAAERGFIARSPGFQFEMHPLLQEFLLAKLHEMDEAEKDAIVGRALRSLGRAHRWDECLAVLAGFPGTALAIPLLEEALEELLATGRIATVTRWLSLVPRNGGDNPIVLLAHAEVAVREGRDVDAHTIAERAAERSTATEVAARAHLVAARAAHMLCNDAGARANAQRAASLTRLDQVRTDARRVELMSAIEAEDAHARELLTTISSESSPAPEQAILVRQANGFLALLADGDVRQALRDLEPAMGLLPHLSDPLARTGLLNLLAMAQVWVADYEGSLETVTLQIEDARASGIDFAAEHALISRVGALIGLRRLGAAQRLLSQLGSRNARSSAFIMSEVDLLTARLRVSAGDLEGAELLLRGPLIGEGLTRSSRGERLASRGLYLAALGDLSGARAAIEEARVTSRFLGTQALSDLAVVIVNLQEQPGGRLARREHEAITEIFQLGRLDALVLACRAFPRLAKCATADETLVAEFTSLLARSHDVDLGRAAGLQMPRELRRSEGLSKREHEVYELLAQGRSNREIAKTLFISESTTKVHVRHILEKLKVHTRAQAAAANIRDDV